MFLKKIVIFGFKSFADRITLNLDKGITGVVGPNGSGKSNVIDAVRWVMGEQNAKNLRGEKATDIIFAGSEKRKQLSMAEVTLVFDNSEESSFCPYEYRHDAEISLTRRLYIDGQREYMINKKACRLKDIVDFFATTGLGGRSYSMIQQGQVDRILNAKPEDVREILEEAAGTMIFKKRRLESEKKLEFTRQNLARVDDILSEVGKQRDTLEVQAEEAKQYQKLSDDYKELEIFHTHQNYLAFQKNLQQTSKEVSQSDDKEAQLLTDLSRAETRLEELQIRLEKANPELAEKQEMIASLRESIARREAELLNAVAKLQAGEKRLATISDDLKSAQDSERQLQTRLEEKKSDWQQVDEQLTLIKDTCDQLEQDLEVSQESSQVYDAKVADINEEIKSLSGLIQSNHIRQESLQREDSELTEKISQWQQRQSVLREEVDSCVTEHTAAQVEVEKKQGGLEQHIDRKHAIEKNIADTMGVMQEKSVERDSLKESCISLRATMTSLEDAQWDASDFGQQLHRLREEITDLDSLTPGLVAEFLSFNENLSNLSQEMIRTIELWAERLWFTDVGAFDQFSKAVQFSQIGVFPIFIGSLWRKPNAQETDSFIATFGLQAFLNYVELDRAPELLTQVLQGAFVASHEIPINELLTNLPQGVTVFHGRGSVLSHSPQLTIGSRKGEGILVRQDQLRRSKKQLVSDENLLKTLDETIQAHKQTVEKERKDLVDIEQFLNQENQQLLGAMSLAQKLQQSLDHKRHLYEEAEQRLSGLNDRSQAISSEAASLADSSFKLEEQKHNAEATLDQMVLDSAEYLDRRDELKRQWQTQQLEKAKLEERLQALMQIVEDLQIQGQDYAEKTIKIVNEEAQLRQEITTAEADDSSLRQKLEQEIRQREDLEQVVNTMKDQNSGVIEEIRETESRLQSSREQLDGMQKQKVEGNLAIERLNIALQTLKQQLYERHQIAIESLPGDQDPDFDQAKSQKQLDNKKKAIDSMGPINMRAIDEFTELENRIKFISGQQEEIISSVLLLEEAIIDIETTSRKRFMQTFEKINHEFGDLFPVLFPGGCANLQLTDPEDPLRGGVEIFVQLPGKKQQRMNLFSGGEKALTAISLIFALLKTKPTPFCFLDEVDAPLDEANVGRYNHVLEVLADRFQFIVITHNRRTMEVLDTLYGVTMQEGGVSKVVGVDMRKDLPAHLRKALEKDEAKRQGASASA